MKMHFTKHNIKKKFFFSNDNYFAFHSSIKFDNLDNMFSFLYDIENSDVGTKIQNKHTVHNEVIQFIMEKMGKITK